MRKLFTLLSLLVVSLGFSQIHAVYVFRPDSGLNNGLDSGTVNGGMDAWAYEGNPSANNINAVPLYALPSSNCNSTKANAYIRFDVKSIFIPAAIDSVCVGFKHLPHTSYCYSHCSANFYFAHLTGKWNEQTITYNNQPSRSANFYGPIPISFPNDFGVKEYNITQAYNDWKTGAVPNNGFVIYSDEVGCNNAAVGFYANTSDDTAVTARPYLKFYYHYMPAGIEGNEFNASQLVVGPVPATEQLNITLRDAESGDYTVKLYDLSGKLCFEQNWKSEKAGDLDCKVKLNAQLNGIYEMRIEHMGWRVNKRIAIIQN